MTSRFLEWFNDGRGGLVIDGKRYGLRYVWVGDGSSSAQVTNATAHAVRAYDADFTFNSYGSPLTALAVSRSTIFTS